MSQPLEGRTASLRMPAIERTYPHGERKIIGSFAIRKNELLDSDAAEPQPTRRKLRGGARDGLRDGLGRAVDGKDMALADPPKDCTGSNAGPAADFQHAHAGAKRKRFDDLGKSG